MKRAPSLRTQDLYLKGGAAVAVVLLHGLFFQVLGLADGRPLQVRTTAAALRAGFIERPAEPVLVELPMPVIPAAADPAPRRTAPAPARPSRRPSTSPSPGTGGADTLESLDAAERPLVLDWTGSADAVAGISPGATGPVMAEPVAGAPPGRFRMRRQLSGKDVVEGTAKALGLWPEGYTTDPCPRIRRYVSRLMTDGSAAGRALAEEELRRQKVACGD